MSVSVFFKSSLGFFEYVLLSSSKKTKFKICQAFRIQNSEKITLKYFTNEQNSATNQFNNAVLTRTFHIKRHRSIVLIYVYLYVSASMWISNSYLVRHTCINNLYVILIGVRRTNI